MAQLSCTWCWSEARLAARGASLLLLQEGQEQQQVAGWGCRVRGEKGHNVMMAFCYNKVICKYENMKIRHSESFRYQLTSLSNQLDKTAREDGRYATDRLVLVQVTRDTIRHHRHQAAGKMLFLTRVKGSDIRVGRGSSW